MTKWDIAALEMVNILIALRLWKNLWVGKTVEMFCDNLAVVTVLQSGRTKDEILATISRNIFMLAAKFDIFIKVSHVPGKMNKVADLLSRLEDRDSQWIELANLVPNVRWENITDQFFHLDDRI